MARRISVRTALLVALGLGAVVGGTLTVWFMSTSTLDVSLVGREGAFAEMDLVRAGFPGQVPCVDRDPNERLHDGQGEATAPRALRMLAWEREDDRLVRVSTPYWALRIAAFKMNAARLMVPALKYVELVDLERCGPGLIVDRRTAGGGRVVVWIE